MFDSTVASSVTISPSSVATRWPGLEMPPGGVGASRGGATMIGAGPMSGGAGCRADSPEADSPAVRAMRIATHGRACMIDAPTRIPRSVTLHPPGLQLCGDYGTKPMFLSSASRGSVAAQDVAQDPAGDAAPAAGAPGDARDEPGEERLGRARLEIQVAGAAELADQSLARQDGRFPAADLANLVVETLREGDHVTRVADIGRLPVHRHFVHGAVGAEQHRAAAARLEEEEPLAAEEGLGAAPLEVEVDLRRAGEKRARLDEERLEDLLRQQ